MLITNSIKNILYKLRLIMKTPTYIYSMAGIFILLFTSTFSYESKSGSVITANVLYNLVSGRVTLTANELNNILNSSGNGYFYMFSQVIAVLPFLIFYVSEKKMRFNIYQLTREKRSRYIIESYITCALAVFILIISAILFYDAVFIVICRGIGGSISGILIHNVFSALSNVLSALIQVAIVGFIYNVFSTVGLFFTMNYYIFVASQKAGISNGSNWIICLPDQMVAYYNSAPMLQGKILCIVIIKLVLIIFLEIINNRLRRKIKC